MKRRIAKKQTGERVNTLPANKPVRTPIYNTLVISPTNRSIRDIGSWKSALRAADYGIRVPLYDLYADILLDGTVTDAIGKRIEAITDCDIHFTIDGREVPEIEDMIDSLEFEHLLEEIIWSRFWGITLDEFYFTPVFGFNSIPRKHIRPLEKVVVRQQYDNDGISYENDTMVIQWGRDDDLGLLLKIAPYVIYKRGGFGDWAQFVEIFGMPQRIGKYNSMDEQSRLLLIRAFENQGAAPYMVVPKESEVETTMMSSNINGALYNDFRNACNEEILITILGQTMTTRDGASLSQSRVHLAVQEKKHRSDRRFVIRELNEFFLPLLERRGYPVSGGRFSFVDHKDELTTDEVIKLSQVMNIPVSWVRTSRGIPEPKGDEPVLRPLNLSPQTLPSDSDRNSAEPPDKSGDKADDELPVSEKPDVEEAVKNADRSFFRRLIDFFAAAPQRGGAGIIRMNDDDPIDERVIKAVWNGEDLLSPDLFYYFSDNLLKAVQRGFEGGLNNADVGITYNAPDDVFRTAMEMNLFHFSAAKSLAEIRELNRLLRESKNFSDFHDKALSVTNVFNKVWQKTEYDTAVLTAESFDTYRRLRSQSKLFPFWEYKTVEDDKVRWWHQKLDGVVLPAKDKRWNKIYPPNGWRCRCRVIGLMQHQLKPGQTLQGQKTVDEVLQSPEWKQAEAQGWGVNRCDTAEIFTANQMYINKFPGNAMSYLKKMTADKWGAGSVPVLKSRAKSDIPLTEQNENEIWKKYEKDNIVILKDYRGRDITLTYQQFLEHTTEKGRDNRIKYWDAMLDTLKNPDEVWLNDEIKHDQLDTYCLLKYYRDNVMVVNFRIENDTLALKTWYIMLTIYKPGKSQNGNNKKNPLKIIWNKRRRGLLLKNVGEHPYVRPVLGND